MTHLLFHKTPNLVSSEPGAAHAAAIDVNVIQEHPIADAAIPSVSEVSLLLVDVDRHPNLEDTFRQGPGDVNVARTIVPIAINF
jgi:hypothetical protein